MDRTELVHALAAMDDDEFADAVRDARGDTAELNPMEKAAAALRRSRGLDRKKPASKEEAASALNRLTSGGWD